MLAQEAHVDAFALNIAYVCDVVSNSSTQAFAAAQGAGFELLFLFGYTGSTGSWSQADVFDHLL